MSEWKEFTGSDDQIYELKESLNKYGFITGSSGIRWTRQAIPHEIAILKLFELATHYLICEPHPLVEMICQQARTGQQVWVKCVNGSWGMRIGDQYTRGEKHFIFATNTPDWNIPGAEYSFEPFKEELCK